MKKVFWLLLVFLSGCAAAVPVKQEDLTYQKVIELPSHPKDVIFEKSKQWIALTFKSAKAVVEYENKAEGVIIGNGSMPRPISVVHIGNGSLITYSMREDIKDGKARLTFDHLVAISAPSYNAISGVLPGGESPILQADLEGVRLGLDSLTSDLHRYIIGGKADW